jgi:hypothetical protein
MDFTFDDDILFQNGDFLVSDTTNQEVKHILIARKGWYKNAPFVGVGIEDYLNSKGKQNILEDEIRTQLTNDGLQLLSQLDIDITTEKLELDIDVKRI